MNRIQSLRRSFLAVPASNTKALEKARTLEVDSIFLDLEDGVALSAKSVARENIVLALAGGDRSTREFISPFISIRINALDTDASALDLALVAQVGTCLDSIVVPKVNGVKELEILDLKLAAIEKELGIDQGSIAIDAQIESALGLINSAQIAQYHRVASLSFGPLDYLADIGSPTTDVPLHLVQYPLSAIVVAARAAGKIALDGPTVEFKDSEKFLASARFAAELGFDGKWVIHPAQIEICHQSFTPSSSQYTRAKNIISAYDQSVASGEGAFAFEGKMIDAATIKMAQVILARGNAGGLT